jgi:peptidoglycan/LPS O-acetylase OafA/YrhL
VLLVVWHHLPDAMFGPLVEQLKFVVRPGYLGVDVFFVLSGFLITRILLADRERGKPLKRFLFRRFARIFPIYYLMIAVMALIRPGGYLWWCATYTCNWLFAVDKTPNPMEHTWSLCVEEHFYLVWPFLVYALSPAGVRRAVVWGIFPLAVGGAIVTAWCEPWLPAEADGLIYRLTPYRIVSLGLGALLALHEARLRATLRGLLVRTGAMVLPSLAIIPAVLLVDHQWVGPIMLVGFALFSGGVVLTGLAAHQYGGPLRPVLENRGLRWVGRVSYGLYLYHVPIYFALGLMGRDGPDLPSLWTAALGVALAFATAALSYRLIEQPILRWAGSSLVTPRRKGPPADASGPAGGA